MAMQKACEAQPSTMAAIIALPDEKVEEICEAISKEGEVVVAANYNCPGQIVMLGSIEGINKACEQMKAAGAKRALPLKVGGAFHSPLMNPANWNWKLLSTLLKFILRNAQYIRMWTLYLTQIPLKSRQIWWLSSPLPYAGPRL